MVVVLLTLPAASHGATVRSTIDTDEQVATPVPHR
jgi:hypothetical protein